MKQLRQMQRLALQDLERRLTEHAFLCSEEASIADLVACCELDSIVYLPGGISLLGKKYPKTEAWLRKMVDDDLVVF